MDIIYKIMYIFEYSLTDSKDNNQKIKKHIISNINKNKENNYNNFNIYNTREEKENDLNSIINNITRKVQFLNSKNNVLSDENTMNLLNFEEKLFI